MSSGAEQGRGITFHLPESWLGRQARGMLPFYTRLFRELAARGIATRAVPLHRDRLTEEIAADDWFHILNHAAHPHPRVLSAGIAYLYPFWHLDPQGIRAFSSIADLPFRPDEVDAEAATVFFRRQKARLVGQRISRYEQPQVPATGLPKGAIAVFLQSEGHRIVGETCYLDRWTMLETTLEAAQGRPVIVKPHPREKTADVFEQLLSVQDRHPQLHISLDNIHDILAVADRVVTINSAVGVEAYLHRKPVILCGKADFHHIATTAETAQALAAALTTHARDPDYAKYLYWYFGLHCLNAGAPDLTARFLARITARGYDLFRPDLR